MMVTTRFVELPTPLLAVAVFAQFAVLALFLLRRKLFKE